MVLRSMVARADCSGHGAWWTSFRGIAPSGAWA
jgi:hypothetical protein